MSAVRHRAGWVILASFLIALMLDFIPLPADVARVRPQITALVLIYWVMALPRRVGVGFGWMAGLMLDVGRATLLGQHALAFALMAFLTMQTHQRLRVFPLWQQSVSVLVILLVGELLVAWTSGVSGYPRGDHWYLLSPFTSTLLWPWAFVILRDLRRHYRVA